MESKKLYFSAEENQIDYKAMLKKDFLELKIRAISTANPNRNMSWFTEESLEASKDTVLEKPILGYFENGDFVSHNGSWKKDAETGMSYWDTLDTKGEIPLGFIRSTDKVEIEKDEKGLSWLTVTCALWTQYNFKQVKRLLKDAKKAKAKGGATKSVSVEVDITDWEELDNGVLKINKFNLQGITILGSRNGVPVEPGIEGAELSVSEIADSDKEVFAQQLGTIKMAYEKLNDSDIPNEEGEPMNLGEEDIIPGSTVGTESVNNTEPEATSAPTEDNTQSATFEGDVCPVCGKNPCECEDCHQNNEDNDNNHDDNEPNDDEDHDEDDENHQNNSCGCEPCVCQEPAPTPDKVIHDIAYLINDCSWNIENLNCSLDYYSNSELPEKDYVVAVLARIINRQKESESELADLLATITAGVTQENLDYEAKLSKYGSFAGLIDSYENLVETFTVLDKRLKEAESKVTAYEHEAFLAQAKDMLENASITEEAHVQIYALCENGEINNVEMLEQKINEAPKQEADLDSDIVPPTTQIFKTEEKTDRWSRMKKNVGRE